jgi:multiple antibiotic resistance protein
MNPIEPFLQLFVLFFGIIDPLVSLGVFVSLTFDFSDAERRKTALYAVIVAAVPLLLFIFFGLGVLGLLNIELRNFQVAGGILLGILGIKMALGQNMSEEGKVTKGTRSAMAVATLIGTPLLTGPAAITTAIITSGTYGPVLTATASLAVLLSSFVLLLLSKRLLAVFGKTTFQLLSTMLGLVTIAWGVQFIRHGMGL